MLNRRHSLERLGQVSQGVDIAIIGGGATGMGIAVDAASRGYSVALLEQADFGKGTSSRSTKLIHGGVRYLQQGNISLVMEALRERGILRNNAPHLVHDLPFIVPNYAWWQAPFYGIGMKVYDLLAGKFGFGKSRLLSRDEVLAHIPTLESDGLKGGVLYYDGQFDDARLLIDLAHTAAEYGAILLNDARATNLLYDADHYITGLAFIDGQTNLTHRITARCVINATGPFSDAIRRIDNPAATAMIAASQGVHLVLDKSFLPGDSAIMVPHTSDGRVMFAIPWHGHTLLGTTDVPVESVALEPIATEAEIDFILENAGAYLAKAPARADILSVFAGIRPLFKSGSGATASLARDHVIQVADSGLITIAGGKWTTYRKMAQDAVDHAATLANLDERPCITTTLKIHGHDPNAARFGRLSHYGAAAEQLLQWMREDPPLAVALDETLGITPAEVLYAVRNEMALTVEDVLARRTRALFLDARRAIAMGPQVAKLMAQELRRSPDWSREQVDAFAALARHYLPSA